MSNETVDSLGVKPLYRAVKTSRLYEQIVQQVEESILKGQLKPGDQLRFELDLLQVRGPMCKMQGVAKVDGEIVCEAEMSAMVRDR